MEQRLAVGGVAAVVIAGASWWWFAAGGADAPSPAAAPPAVEAPAKVRVVEPAGGGGRMQAGQGTRAPADLPVEVPASWNATSALEAAGAAFVVFEVPGDAAAEARSRLAATGCPVSEAQQGAVRIWSCGAEPRWQGLQISVAPGDASGAGATSRVSVAWRR